MPTVSAGSSSVIDVAIGQKIAVSTPGEAYVDVVAGALGAGYTSKRLADNSKEQTFGPYGMVTRLNIRAIVGTATYGEAVDQTTSGAVASVNMKVGNVELTAADVGAMPAPYAIGAVHFDGANTSLVNDALSCTNSGYVGFSFWMSVPVSQLGKAIWTVDPVNDYSTLVATASDGALSVTLADHNKSLGLTQDGTFGTVQWHHFLGAARTDLAAGSKIVKLYIDDVDVTAGVADGSLSFNAVFAGVPFVLGDDTYGGGAIMDLADFWLAPGANLLTDGGIAEATRRKFISAGGSPVNLGANGELPTGTAPAIFLHCDSGAAAATFADNRGTGGAFAVVGTLSEASTTPPVVLDAGFNNPMTGAGDLIVGGAGGAAVRLANPGAGTFNLRSVDGVLTWVAA